jgi:hypothetical protein
MLVEEPSELACVLEVFAGNVAKGSTESDRRK